MWEVVAGFTIFDKADFSLESVSTPFLLWQPAALTSSRCSKRVSHLAITSSPSFALGNHASLLAELLRWGVRKSF